MDFIEELHRFDLKEHNTFNDQISDIRAYHNIVVSYFHKLLLRDANAGLTEFDYQSVLVNLFKKTTTKPVA